MRVEPFSTVDLIVVRLTIGRLQSTLLDTLVSSITAATTIVKLLPEIFCEDASPPSSLSNASRLRR